MAINTDASVDFAKNVINTKFEDLTATGIEQAKMDILDTLGTLLGGSTADAGAEVVELAKEFGGNEQATIMAYGGKVPAPMAAFCNATMAHALDLDDTHASLPVHIGPIIVDAIFAVAEAKGGITGKEAIVALAVGADMMSRLAKASTYPIHKYGFMFTPLYGYFGATAAVGRLLGLNEEQMVNAFGIAYAQCAGNVQVNIDDEHALTKRLSCGFASRGGVMAGLLAQKNLTGAQHSLEGRFGLFNIYQRGDYDHDTLVADLGKVYEIDNLSYKPWASCRQTHPYIDAALQLKKQYNINAEDIEKVTIFTNTGAGAALCEPLDLRQHPTEEVHAQFSIPYTVGVALTKGVMPIDAIKVENLADPAVMATTEKIEYVIDEELNKQKLLAPQHALTITMKDGTVYESNDPKMAPKGDPRNMMTMDEFKAKFLDCATYAPKKISDENLQKVIDLVLDLENVDDISVIPALLA